jgi:hypothetical protein
MNLNEEKNHVPQGGIEPTPTLFTLASGIDVGQGINIGPGKFGKKNKCRALNTHVLCSK